MGHNWSFYIFLLINIIQIYNVKDNVKKVTESLKNVTERAKKVTEVTEYPHPWDPHIWYNYMEPFKRPKTSKYL